MKKTLIIITVLAMIFAGCKSKDKDAGENTQTDYNTVTFTQEQIKVAGIEIDTISKHTLSVKIPSSGLVEVIPGNKINLSVPIAGYVKKFYIHHGDKVYKGQPLIDIENLEFIDMQSEYLQKKSKLGYLKLEYERQNKLFEQNAIPKKKLEQAKSEYYSMLADVKGLEAKLELLGIDTDKINSDNIKSYITLKSPIDGFVGEINVNLKQYLSPEDNIMTIINPNSYMIMLNVYGKYSTIVKIGQKVEFTISKAPQVMYGHIYSTSYSLDPQTKTFKVHVMPDKAYPGLIEGAFVSAHIFANTQKVYALPAEAIIYNNENAFVYVDLGDYKFEKVPVKLGMKDNNYVEILNYQDLLGKKIAVKGANYIKAKLELTE